MRHTSYDTSCVGLGFEFGVGRLRRGAVRRGVSSPYEVEALAHCGTADGRVVLLGHAPATPFGHCGGGLWLRDDPAQRVGEIIEVGIRPAAVRRVGQRARADPRRRPFDDPRDRVVGVLGRSAVPGHHDRLAEEHRLRRGVAEALGAMRRDIAVAELEQGIHLAATEEAVDDHDVVAAGRSQTHLLVGLREALVVDAFEYQSCVRSLRKGAPVRLDETARVLARLGRVVVPDVEEDRLVVFPAEVGAVERLLQALHRDRHREHPDGHLDVRLDQAPDEICSDPHLV